MSFIVNQKPQKYECVQFNENYDELISFIKRILPDENMITDINISFYNEIIGDINPIVTIDIADTLVPINNADYKIHLGDYIINENGNIEIYNEKEFHEKYECEPPLIEYTYIRLEKSNIEEIVDFLHDTEFKWGKHNCIRGYSYICNDETQSTLFLTEGDYIVKHPNKSIRIFKPDQFIKKFNIKGD